MKNIKLIFFTVLFLGSCIEANKIEKIKKIKSSKGVFCKIISSSTDNYKLLSDAESWRTSNIGKDDIIIFSMLKPIFINKIKINFTDTNIHAIKIYTNNGVLSEFSKSEIEINQLISFIIFKISETSNFCLTNAFDDTNHYKIAFKNNNTFNSLNKIDFYANDTTKIDLYLIKNIIGKQLCNNSLTDVKLIDYSTSAKSCFVSSAGQILASENDTVYWGHIIKSGKNNLLNNSEVKIKKLMFYDDKYASKTINTSVDIDAFSIKFRDALELIYDFKDEFLVEVRTFDPTIIQDIRYATENNFTHTVIYDCACCLLRYGAAKDLVKAQKEFMQKGFRIKIFDAYRPHQAQYKLWEVVPNKNYVANPQKGSIHNRGAAVDLTLVDSLGNELDMGTEFDYFGYKAFSINLDLPDTVLHNRQLLWSVLNKNGFKKIKTEWWHLSHYSCMKYKISDMPLPCEECN